RRLCRARSRCRLSKVKKKSPISLQNRRLTSIGQVQMDISTVRSAKYWSRSMIARRGFFGIGSGDCRGLLAAYNRRQVHERIGTDVAKLVLRARRSTVRAGDDRTAQRAALDRPGAACRSGLGGWDGAVD